MPTQNNNNMNAQDLKKGSIVRMTYSTNMTELRPEWTIRSEYFIGEGEQKTHMIHYVADCVVNRVTAKFFTVIIPHSNRESVRYSKDCFTTTKMSYADDVDFKASIVKI